MSAVSKPVPYGSLVVLHAIQVLVAANRQFPIPSDVYPDETMRGSAVRHFKRLEDSGMISRNGKRRWDEAGSVTELGILQIEQFKLVASPLALPKPNTRAGRKRYLRDKHIRRSVRPSVTIDGIPVHRVRHFKVGDTTVRLSAREQETLYYIGEAVAKTGHMPSTNSIAEKVYNKLTSHSRAHTIQHFSKLERLGLVARREKSRGKSWQLYGFLTESGTAVALMLSAPKPAPVSTTARFGGGLAQDGGTRFKDMLFSADQLGTEGIVQVGDRYSKIGRRAKKGSAGGHQKGLKIATFSLEEGKTCSPSCGLRDVCYAGKMSRQRRILYEGEKTDRAVAKAIADSGPMHWRINTVGDIPTQSFLEAVLVAVVASCSTAWGYTHWAPEHWLGQKIRRYSDRYWNFFAIRTSYEHGSRKPLPERGAVIMQEFDPKLLALHNAVACPEQAGEAKSCGECGYCWTTRRNVAFKIH